jgi:hypothetical protein
MRRLGLALVLLGLASAPSLQAQPRRADAPRLSPRARVSLLTILPGDGAADAFGHSALRVRDPALGLDRTYNYGTYNFRDPYFIPKFTYGRLTYLLTTSSFDRLLRKYRYLDRPVIEQRLTLSRAQAQRLFAFLEWNARPANRAYRYDFLFDNCATRIRDALRDALSDSLRFGLERLPRRPFRHHLDRYVAGMAPLDFGFDLALGLPTDQLAPPREAMFLPEYLMEGFAGATVQTNDGRGEGTWQPLVTRTDTLFWRTGAQFPARPAFPWIAGAMWGLFAALGGATAWRWRQGRPPMRGVDVLLFGAVGAAGVVIWFLTFLSEHVVTRYNLNAVWALPTHLILAGALLLGRGGERLARGYLWASGAAAGLLALGWPLWPQDLHAAALPLVLMLVLRSAHRGWTAAAPGERNVPERQREHADAAS